MSKPARSIVIASCGAAILLVVATACGGDKSSSGTTTSASTATSAEQWSTDVCTAITSWKQNVSKAAKSIVSNPSKEQVTLAIEHTRQWTQALAQKLHEVGPPGTSPGNQARQTLTTLVGQLRERSDKIQTALGYVSGAKGSVEAVSTASTTLVTMRDEVKTAGEKLRALPKGELKQALSTTPSCQHLASTAA